MLDTLPFHVLDNIVGKLHDIKDIFALYKMSKSMNNYVTNNLFSLDVHLEEPKGSLIFLRELKSMKYLRITRQFDSALDLTPLYICHKLNLIYLNSLKNVFNIPSNIMVRSGRERLVKYDKAIHGRKKAKNEESDEEEKEIDVKAYFQNRYMLKKYSRICHKRGDIVLSSSI